MFRRLPVTGICLDIGGGTGILYREVISAHPNAVKYVCLDQDPAKLRGLPNESSTAAIIGDAGLLPIQSQSIGCAVLMAVTHHIPPNLLHTVIAESLRILQPDGYLVFLDALWTPSRLISRALWRLDRGSFPHTEETLLAALGAHGEIEWVERYQIYHRYIICLVKPRSGTPAR